MKTYTITRQQLEALLSDARKFAGHYVEFKPLTPTDSTTWVVKTTYPGQIPGQI